MKTTITILMLLIAIAASIFSFIFFTDGTYYISALLTITAYLAASTSVYLMTEHKKAVLH